MKKPVVKVDTTSPGEPAKPGTMEVIEEDGIHRLMQRHLSICDSLGTIAGYRVQVYFGSGPGSQTAAKKAKVQFIRSFPGVPAYITSEDPNFKVRVGNYRTRLEAQGAIVNIKKEFPNCFIVQEQIELPGLD